MADNSSPSGIDLVWIPLGVGGSGWVRFNGRVYERVLAFRDRRRPVALYHTALWVTVPEGVYLVETVLPRGSDDLEARGVVLVAPAFIRWLSHLRVFSYEVRCWKDGVLPDGDEAVGGPQRVSDDRRQASRVLELAASVPPLVWGRDERTVGEMWNSNSVISWLLARSGVPLESVHPPSGGRAPGWDAGLAVARSEE